jgi:hypothetical protein
MMLAEGRDLDVLDDDQLFMILSEHGIVDDVYISKRRDPISSLCLVRESTSGERSIERQELTRQLLLVTLGHPKEGFGVSVGRTKETFSIWVLAEAFEEGSDGFGQTSNVCGGLVGGRVQAVVRRFGCTNEHSTDKGKKGGRRD